MKHRCSSRCMTIVMASSLTVVAACSSSTGSSGPGASGFAGGGGTGLGMGGSPATAGKGGTGGGSGGAAPAGGANAMEKTPIGASCAGSSCGLVGVCLPMATASYKGTGPIARLCFLDRTDYLAAKGGNDPSGGIGDRPAEVSGTFAACEGPFARRVVDAARTQAETRSTGDLEERPRNERKPVRMGALRVIIRCA